MSRALLVIDVQREYFDGAFPVRHPVGHLDTILDMMDAAKGANIPTVVVRHHQLDLNSPVFRKGSEMWQLHEVVESRPRDILIDKQLPGSFTNTALDAFLKEGNIDTVCIAGYMTQVLSPGRACCLGKRTLPEMTCAVRSGHRIAVPDRSPQRSPRPRDQLDPSLDKVRRLRPLFRLRTGTKAEAVTGSRASRCSPCAPGRRKPSGHR